MKKTFLLVSLFLLFIPLFAFGQTGLGTFQNLVQSIKSIVDLLPGILATLAVAAFFWGLTVAIFSTGQEDKAKGKISLWGIIAFIERIFGINAVDNADRAAPKITT